MQSLKKLWEAFGHLPCAWMLLLQFLLLILSVVSINSLTYRSFIWILGTLVLLLIARVIRQTLMFTVIGLTFVSGALIFSFMVLLGVREPIIQITAHCFEAAAYFSAAYGLVRYMFADRYVTKDELFAAAAVFTLISWGFAFLFNACQLYQVESFYKADVSGLKSWLDLLFLSFSLQSATGLADILPATPLAKTLAMLQMFFGVMYLALIVTRLIALQYIHHSPKHKD